jgi:hypothetical protein
MAERIPAAVEALADLVTALRAELREQGVEE